MSALGAVVRIELPAESPDSLINTVSEAWSGAAASTGVPNRTVTLASGNEDQLLQTLSTRVTLEALEHQRGSLLMFHAAGVADAEGRVAAFVGPSGRGKTTLSRALAQSFGYVSDETVGVDSDMKVLSYRKPLSIVRQSQPKDQVSPHQAGLKELPVGSLKLTALVLIERETGLEAPVFEVLALADALEALVAQISFLSDLDEPLERLATLADSVGGVLRMRYSEADTVAPAVSGFFERESVAQTWKSVPPPIEGPYDTGAAQSAIVSDDRVILLTDGWVRVLDGIAPQLWLSARAGSDLHKIMEDVIASHGAPEGVDTERVVRDAIDQLVEAGVLRIDSTLHED